VTKKYDCKYGPGLILVPEIRTRCYWMAWYRFSQYCVRLSFWNRRIDLFLL